MWTKSKLSASINLGLDVIIIDFLGYFLQYNLSYNRFKSILFISNLSNILSRVCSHYFHYFVEGRAVTKWPLVKLIRIGGHTN